MGLKERNVDGQLSAQMSVRPLLSMTRVDEQQNTDVVENAFRELAVKVQTVQELPKNICRVNTNRIPNWRR